ncbi:hypothetical protein ACFLZ1_04630 [Patescibacteria group bacterium]
MGTLKNKLILEPKFVKLQAHALELIPEISLIRKKVESYFTDF